MSAPGRGNVTGAEIGSYGVAREEEERWQKEAMGRQRARSVRMEGWRKTQEKEENWSKCDLREMQINKHRGD
jgi:hypothetical protein